MPAADARLAALARPGPVGENASLAGGAMRGFDDLDRRVVTALRVLAVDQVEQARSGHPGMPLGAAPMAYALWSRFLRHDPADPAWPDRDRFVLSAGHASALLYALLHLFGYDLPLEELERFRQWGSRTPGHPEHGLTPGVEMTTGPLGQGFGAAVGMALAERHLAARFNRPGYELFDHRTWVLASDGDLMEGISHEAASLAGHLRLGRLAVLYDDNRITIDGPTSLSCSDDVAPRFAGYGWRVLHVDDGNDLDAIAGALAETASRDDVPTLIRVRTEIGFGSPTRHGTAEAHGAPLGPAEADATRAALGWPKRKPFEIPVEIVAHTRAATRAGAEGRAAWRGRLAGYRKAHPDLAAELERRLAGELPPTAAITVDFAGVATLATREASGRVLNALAPVVPELLGGSADLAGSTNTTLAGESSVAPGSFAGRNLHFGVREHAMAAVCNGLALHGGLRPYASTFLVFSDYMRPAIRLAAIMKVPVAYVFTHDSVGLGEDGPTHQPVEQLAALRAIPGLVVMRPADAHETVAAWQVALAHRDGPTALVLTRQKLPLLERPPEGAVARGAFVRAEAGCGAPDAVLLATGSEVTLALAARERLEAGGVATRVVSVPSLGLFAAQDDAYRSAVLGPAGALRAVVEMARIQGWERYIGGEGLAIGLERFGASAPGGEAAARLGFTPEAVAALVAEAWAARAPRPLAVQIPDVLTGAVEGRLARLQSLHASARVAARDAALWGDRSLREVSRRLGWLDVPRRTQAELPELRRLVAALAADGARTLYLLGMGGSSLAPWVMREVAGNPSGRELVVVDTTDPERVATLLERLEPAAAAVVPVSKSGTTAETDALLAVFWERMQPAIGERAGGRCVAITEPGTPLARLAARHGFRAVLSHPVDVGGRFSALSVVGVMPALWLGHDVDALLADGARTLERVDDRHPAVELATLLGAVAAEGWARLAFCASPALAPLGAWAEQLVAESTGKDRRGIVPVVAGATGPPHTWPGTLYLSPRFADEEVPELDAALDALAAAGLPVARWTLRRGGLGEAFAVLELATALLGPLLGVNPFDEPDVVRAKERARAALGEGRAAPPPIAHDPARALLDHLRRLDRDDVVALLAYLPERPEVADRLASLAAALSRRLGVPVTTAFGPRYLHSTGQLHKGGPDRIVPVVLTSAPERDVEVPHAGFTLGALRQAQAAGDLAALTEVGRRALHLHLEPDVVPVLAAMAEAAGA
jgi:transketolase